MNDEEKTSGMPMPQDECRTSRLFTCDVPYLMPLFSATDTPWELLPRIKEYVAALVADGIEGFTHYSDTVLIGQNVRIYPGVVIEGPAVIGHGCELRPGAFIRGAVITGEKCVIGNSTELKNCILLSHVDVPHYNYVGDSVLGQYAHLGAGTVCSNLKSDKQNVVIHTEPQSPTGLRKCGALLGDHVEVGCNSVLNPGTVIGRKTRVYPGTVLRGTVREGQIVKSPQCVVPMQ